MIEGTTAGTPGFGGSEPVAQKELDRGAFMSLLVAQMRNQDPMEPTANDQFIAQLAQFSSLEEMKTVNENLVGLAYLQQSNALMEQLTSSSALIGNTVEYIDPATGETEQGEVDSVKIQDGLALLNIGGQDVPLVNVTGVTGSNAGDDSSQDDGTGDDDTGDDGTGDNDGSSE